MADGKEDALAVVMSIADQLGVDLEDQRIAIATDKGEAKVKMQDGSLEVRLTQWADVYIDSPRSPGIYINLVDHQKDPGAPEGAIYAIRAYMPDSNEGVSLNGDVYFVYVGARGIILSDVSKKRVAKLLEEANPSHRQY